jgi:nitrate reductase molybdenum cofactor assembly chaperone NarJ/NarW
VRGRDHEAVLVVRDREVAVHVLDLREMYRQAGLELAAHELPDYVPAFVEYLSVRDLREAREMLRECAHILRSIGERLRDRGSPYQAVFAALLDFAGAPGFGAARSEPAAQRPLDEEWAEEPAFGGCPKPAKPGPSVIRFMPRP